MSFRPIPIVIADAHPVSLGVIRDLLSQEQDLELAGSVGTGTELLELLLRVEPQVLLLEANLPGVADLELIRAAWDCRPHLGILVFRGRDCTDYLQAALVLGDDRRLRQERISLLAPAVRLVAAHGVALAPLELLTLVLPKT